MMADSTTLPQRSLGFCYIAHNCRLAYLFIPKAGCTSLINMLHMAELPGFASIGTSIHREASLPRAYAPTVPASYFRFTFVRNPYQRLLSFYKSKVRRFADPDPQVNQNLVRMGLSEGMPFAAMVEQLAAVRPAAMDLHCAPQHLFVEHLGDSVIDYVGKLENLSTDWKRVQARCPVVVPPLLENQKDGNGDEALYADARVLGLVHGIYQRDFELFGYDRKPVA